MERPDVLRKKKKGDEDENAAMEPSELCVSDHGVSHISPSQMPARSKRINTGVDPRVERHVVQEHGFRDAQQYRTHVLGKQKAAGLQKITAQIIRTRLTRGEALAKRIELRIFVF